MNPSGRRSLERLRELAHASEPRAGLVWAPHGDPETTEILLVRHAQIQPSASQHDVHLTDIGRAQAEALAEFLATLPVAAIYSSPYGRCRQTAEPAARLLGLEIIDNPDLREVDAYLPPGKTLAEALDEDPAKLLLETKLWDSRAPFGESSAAVRQRSLRAVDMAIAAFPGQCVVLVTHGPTIAAVVAELLQSPLDFGFMPSLTSITVVAAKGDKRDLRVVNALPHLYSL